MNIEVPPDTVPRTTTRSRVDDKAAGTGCIEQNGWVAVPAVAAVSLQVAVPEVLFCT
jgi:hypothetical protein